MYKETDIRNRNLIKFQIKKTENELNYLKDIEKFYMKSGNKNMSNNERIIDDEINRSIDGYMEAKIDVVNKMIKEIKDDRDNLKKQLGEGLKILAPQQMLARLTILLAQKQAGNNSQKLKNEIRQLLYSLYRSKKINKPVYERLTNIV